MVQELISTVVTYVTTILHQLVSIATKTNATVNVNFINNPK